MAQQAILGQDLLIIEALPSHPDTPYSVDSSGRGISLTRRPLPDNTQHSHPYPRWASNLQSLQVSGRRPLDRATTGTGSKNNGNKDKDRLVLKIREKMKVKNKEKRHRKIAK